MIRSVGSIANALIFCFCSAACFANDVAAVVDGDRLAPKAFREAAARVRPSLVTIEALAGVTPGRTAGISRPGEGPTTGVIVDSEGFIVTSTFNFIRQPRVISVVLADGTRHLARLMGRDETRKICLLKIDGAKDLTVPAWVKREELRVGQWAISVGIGYGDAQPAISTGIVSALSRCGGRAVQTDANISPANYGGPLIDLDGRIIGICVPLNPMSPGIASGVEWYDSGIGFAIPLAGADKLLTALREEGKIVRPAWLGVQLQPAVDDVKGVVVAAVQPDSPAAKAGVKPADRIVAFTDLPVGEFADLRRFLDRHVAGDRITLQVRRGDDTLSMEIELGSPPPQPRSPAP